MYQYSSKIILFVSFFIFTLQAANVTKRTKNIENDSNISSIPYSFHYEKFQTMVANNFDKLDLSLYQDKKLFVGYGLSDKEEKNCYFVDNAANKNILTDFERPITIGKKTYAMSLATMSYGQCRNIANKYAGYIFNPLTATEFSRVKKRFKDKDFWIGLQRANCGKDYINQYGFMQEFNQLDSSLCDKSKLNIFSEENKYTWKKENKASSHYCLLQIDSPDYLRPIKVCAPWWQIEQTYVLPDNGEKANLLPFYNMDVPKIVDVCLDSTKNSNGVTYEDLYNDKKNWKTTTCVKYYSMKAGESCKEDMLQEQCLVNECSGNIEERCHLQGSYQSDTKNYEIGTIVTKDGIMKKGKIKDRITTYEYLCPPPRKSIVKCKKYKTVKLFPTDKCNPGGCNRYFDCLNNHPTNINACKNLEGGCERKYGHNFIVTNGVIQYAIVKCDNQQEVHNTNFNEYSETKSRCKKYDIIKEYLKKDESCSVDLPKTNHSVKAGLTDADIYMSNPQCIRINNESSQAKNTYYMEFNSTSYFKTKISKVTTVLKPSELNSSLTNESNIVENLNDGKFLIRSINEDNTTTVKTLSDLSSAFSSMNSMVVGDDNRSLLLLNEKEFSSSGEGKATTQPVYKYFNKKWWNKRIFPFDSDGVLTSITRPYSRFAQCVGIPLDSTKSTFGTPYPKYTDGSPRIGSSILRENFESDAYKEKYVDNDINNKGLYCKKNGADRYVNWYGSSANDLYYNTYKCSRLYDNNGNNWATPYQKTFKYTHDAYFKNGTSTKHTVNVTDKAKVYTTKSECESSTGLTCKSVGDPSTITFSAYYLSTTRSATDKYKASNPSVGNSFDWVTGVNSSTITEDYLSHMGIAYDSVSNDTDFRTWLNNAFEDYDSSGILHTNLSASIVVSSTKFIPEDYSLVDGVAQKTEQVDYYSYNCPNKYTAIDAGLSSYTKTDSDTSAVNSTLFDSPNSATPHANNCKYVDTSAVLGTVAQVLSQVKVDSSNGNYCNRISSIRDNNTTGIAEADYNCSKYYGSDGKWDYKFKTYYLYNGTTFKYFRQKGCGYGDLNKAGVNKDGSNALVYDTNSSDFVTNLSKLDIYSENNMSLKYDSNHFKIPLDKLTLSDTKLDQRHDFVDKDLDPAIDIFEIFLRNGWIRLVSIDNMSMADCTKYYDDLANGGYDLKKKIDHNKCIIDMDYFNNNAQSNYTPQSEFSIPFKRGSLDVNQTGINSIMVVEDYIDGKFGYKTNYASRPYSEGNVKIDNKIIFPILNTQSDLISTADLQYKRAIYQKGISTRKSIVPSVAKHSMSAIATVGVASGGTSAAVASAGVVGENLAAIGLGSLAIASLAATFVSLEATAYVVNLFGARQRFGYDNRQVELYMDDNKYRTFENIYGYDPRIKKTDRRSIFNLDVTSGTRKKGDIEVYDSDLAKSLEDIIVNDYGVNKESYENILNSPDKGYVVGYPGLKWWENGPHKRHRQYNYDNSVKKDYNVVYYGATNSVTIFVPFKADYEIIALDKRSNVIGKRTIFYKDFVATSDKQPYKQVFFSLDKNFDLADNIADGNTTGACRFSNVIEWGGGVSGGYYSFNTPKGYTCDKSNDSYVQEHSAKYLAIRKLGSDKINFITLKKPLPFANRVFLVTEGKMETRDYVCVGKANCTIDDGKTVINP